jgi:hypothetical protein
LRPKQSSAGDSFPSAVPCWNRLPFAIEGFDH